MSAELLARIAELESALEDERRRSAVIKRFYDANQDGGVKDRELAIARSSLAAARATVEKLQDENRRLRLMMKKARCESAIEKTRQTIARINKELNKA